MRFPFKTIVPVLAIFACSVGAITSSCTSSAQKVEEAKDDLTEAKEDLAKAQNEYLAEVEAFRIQTAEKITANEKLIADFKVKIATEKAAAKAEYTAKIVALEEKNATMKQRIGDYKETEKEKWQAFKAEFARDMDELGEAINGLVVSSKK